MLVNLDWVVQTLLSLKLDSVVGQISEIFIYIYVTGSICTDDYGSEWGFKTTQQISVSSKPRDYIIAYGLDDSLTKFRTLLKTLVKTDLSSLSGMYRWGNYETYSVVHTHSIDEHRLLQRKKFWLTKPHQAGSLIKSMF